MLPVGVTKAITSLGFLTANRQVIRLPTSTEERTPASATEAASDRLRALRRAVTEAIVRRLPWGDLASEKSEAKDAVQPAPPRVKVFISHAKKDGATIAAELRDGFASVSQLEPWFDANDLAPGGPWAGNMSSAARATTDGLIAVVSDAYHSRYWCQREAQEARSPRRLKKDLRLWGVQPTVALLTTAGGVSRPVPALEGVLHIGWLQTADQRSAEAVEDVVEWWLLEALLARVAERRARDVVGRAAAEAEARAKAKAEAKAEAKAKAEAEAEAEGGGDLAGLALLSFSPDPYTLGRLLGAWRREEVGMPALICFPAHGLPRAGRDRLLEVLVDHGYEPEAARAALTPLEVVVHDDKLWALQPLQLEGAPAAWRRASQPEPPLRVTWPLGAHRIALSAGGEDSELDEVGAGLVHVNELMVRLSRTLLDAGHSLAYAGLLRPPDAKPGPTNLTEPLMRAAQGWASAEADTQANGAKPEAMALLRLRQPPLLNYVPWRSAGGPAQGFRAEWAGVCAFEDVEPPADLAGEWGHVRGRARAAAAGTITLTPSEKALCARFEADALTKMRTKAAGESAARVLMGGKIHGASGWLPGIAEELEASLWANAADDNRDTSAWQPAYAQPVLVLGGFGGMAGRIAAVLQRKIAPEALWGGALQRSADLIAALEGSEQHARYARKREKDLLALLRRFADHLWLRKDKDAVFPGAPWSTSAMNGAVVRRLLREGSPSFAVRTTCQALGERRGAGPPPDAKASPPSSRHA